jgi:anaerobic selenocysteine-containing dehydrogenase
LIRDNPAARGSFSVFREASWDKALDAVAAHLKKLISENRVKEVAMLGGWRAHQEAWRGLLQQVLGKFRQGARCC